jgi:hypothetical protein
MQHTSTTYETIETYNYNIGRERESLAPHTMERSGLLPAMEGASDAQDGEEQAHTMVRSGVS